MVSAFSVFSSLVLHAPLLFNWHFGAELSRLPGAVVLAEVSIAMTRHHDHENSYKGKYFIGAGLQVQRLSPLSS